jgi:hypothetical protein
MQPGGTRTLFFERNAIKHLSAVILMELRAGAFSSADRRLVRRVASAFEKTERVGFEPSRLP